MLPAVGLWLALGAALAAITGRIVDWFLMTDELLYERLAISIAHGRSPLRGCTANPFRCSASSTRS